jgi:hypothetical protein
LAIFGSLTPTSDIDVGINYLGRPLETPVLAYVVSRIENLFLLFTNGSSTLDFDIELYSDIITLPKPNNPNENYFYLDSTKFTEDNLKKMLVIACNSIARNAYVRNPAQFGQVTISSIRATISRLGLPVEILDNLSEDMFNRSKETIKRYFRMTYDQQRNTYYEKVTIAEKYVFDNIARKEIGTIDPDIICEAMYLIGDSLTYRMESYNCAPTVVHVVRIYQANKDNPEVLEKYETCTPAVCCNGEIISIDDPYCSIGPYGYLLSALEQIGYLYRFGDQKRKYIDRYTNALSFYDKLKPTPKPTPVAKMSRVLVKPVGKSRKPFGNPVWKPSGKLSGNRVLNSIGKQFTTKKAREIAAVGGRKTKKHQKYKNRKRRTNKK